MSVVFQKSHLSLLLTLLLFCLSVSLQAQQAASTPAITPEVQSLLGKASIAQSRYQWKEALVLFNQALEKAHTKKDKRGEVTTIVKIGMVYSSISQPQRALEQFEKALPILQQVKDKQGEAATLNNIGNVYLDLSQPQKALEQYEKALPLEREVEDKQGEATTLSNISSVYSRIGQPQKALEQFEKALPILQRVGDKVGEATTLNNIGFVYWDLGQPQKALEQFEKALTLLRQGGDKEGEATALNGIGVVYSSIGQPQKALEQYEKALMLEREVNDKRGEATTLNNIGQIYWSIGQLQKALEQFNNALLIMQHVGDKRGEATVLNASGVVYSDLGQPQKALELYEKALTLRRQGGDKEGEATTLNNIGSVYWSIGQLQKALEQFEKALPILQLVGDKVGEGYTLHNAGSAYSDLGQFQKALEQFEKALTLARKVGDKQVEAGTFSSIALLAQEQGHISVAVAHFKQAIDLNEQYREQIGTLSDAKISFLQGKLPNYHFLIHLVLRQKSIPTAFDLAQKTKARALVDLMAGGKVNLNGKLTTEEQAEQQRRQLEVRRLHNALLKASLSKNHNSENQALQQALDQAERNLQTLQDQLANLHPDLLKERAARTVTLAEVARFLPQDTAVLEYVQLYARTRDNKIRLDQIVLFVVTVSQGKAVVEAYPLSGTNRQWRERSHDFVNACSDPQADYEEKASALAAQLLPPSARARLAGKKHLLICPDGPLWGLPFQALRTPQGQFWLQQYEISYAYSATGAEAALSASKRKGRPAPSGTLLAFANPDFGGENRFESKEPLPLLALKADPARPLIAESKRTTEPQRPLIAESRRSPVTERGGIKPLEGTQKEAEALQAAFPSGPPQVLVLTGKQAQKEIALKEMGKYRYLHFATHGWFSDTSPLQSCVVLAEPPPEQKEQGEEGFLTARELFDLNLSAELVVLSACDTARGGNESGEGMVGLTWALFVAGAPTQVVSQWSVSDASTAALMQAFYANLTGKHMAKGAALREAALHLEKDPQHRHPYYWAPFILLGDWR